MEFFFWVFLGGVLLYLPFFMGFGVFPAFILEMPMRVWWLVIFSGLFQSIYMICLIQAYRTGDLSLVYPVARSAPLFTQIWAVSFIGEAFSVEGFVGISLVMTGLFFISLKDFPGGTGISLPSGAASRPTLFAIAAALASSIYSVIDKVGVLSLHPVFYIWLINLWMVVFIGLYLSFKGEGVFVKVWRESKKEIVIITILQNAAYLLVLLALQMSKVSYVVAFRQVGALFGAGMGIVLLKESHWKTRLSGALILTLGLVLIGLAH